MTNKIIQCQASDINILQQLCIETFQESFAEMNTEENMQQYLHDAFNLTILAEELSSPGSRYFFLKKNDAIIGYLKVNKAPFQTDINDPNSLEIERIYIRTPFKRMGFGRELMNFALSLAVKENLTFVWLGVWEKNSAAIQFYEKHGFIVCGKHKFLLGDEQQSDLIMQKKILSDDWTKYAP